MSIALDATGWLTAAFPGAGGAGTTTSISYQVHAGSSTLVVMNPVGGGPVASQPSISLSDGTNTYSAALQVAVNDGSNNWSMVAIHVALAVAAATYTIVSTNSAGAFNCAARGVGGPDMLYAVTTGKAWFRVGETIRYDLSGRLRPGVSAKDIFLTIAGKWARMSTRTSNTAVPASAA